MNPFRQPRVSAIARCTAVIALASFCLTTVAQAPPVVPAAPAAAAPAQSPGSPEAANAASKKAPKPISETLTKKQLEAAEDAYLAGARLLDKKNLSGAEAEFAKAVKINPANHEYVMAAAVAHEQHVTQLVQQVGKARLLGQKEKAETLLAEARLLDPQNEIVLQHLDPNTAPKIFRPEIEPWIREGPAIAGPITLLPNSGVESFHLHSDMQDVMRHVLSSYGIRPQFDESVKRDSLRFDLDDTTYQEAVPILLRMAHVFAVPLDSTSVLIASDTPDNRQRFERLLQETIYIPAMTNEEMDALGNVVRQVFDVKQAVVEKSSGNLVLRAPEDILTAINQTLADLIDGGSEVLIELKLYTVDRTKQTDIGVSLPQQIGVYSVASAANALVAQNQTLVTQAIAQGLVPPNATNIIIALALIASGLVQSSLLSSTIGVFGGGLTQFGVTIDQNPTLHLALNSSNTVGLDDIQVRIADRQTATFRVGSRYPITTATYQSGITAAAPGLAGITINGVSASSLLSQVGNSVTIPQIQYEDIGLTLKAIATVQKSGEVTMHLDLKIESLTGNSSDNIPILDSRLFVSDVTVPDGEPALILGTLSRSESASINGTPGLGELPGFQYAAADNTKETDSSEIILLVTPHVVRHRSDATAGPRIAINLPEQPD
jgi:general secretion pathway protein D